MRSLTDALQDGWQIEDKLTNHAGDWVGYMMRKMTPLGWIRAKLIIAKSYV